MVGVGRSLKILSFQPCCGHLPPAQVPMGMGMGMGSHGNGTGIGTGSPALGWDSTKMPKFVSIREVMAFDVL